MDIKKGVYEHYRGKKYVVLGIGLDKNSQNESVIYKPLYECEYEYFIRALADFCSSVTIEGKEVPKFTYIGPYDPLA